MTILHVIMKKWRINIRNELPLYNLIQGLLDEKMNVWIVEPSMEKFSWLNACNAVQ